MSLNNVTRVKHVVADRAMFLKNLAETPNHTVLKLTATWCGPCKQIAEYTRQASLRLPANVDLIECDVDESFDLYLHPRFRCLLFPSCGRGNPRGDCNE